MIRHIVHLRFAADVTDARKQGFYTALAGLSDHVDGMVEFRSFANQSPERDLVRGFDDVFWIDFADAASRDAYLSDPRHETIAAHLMAATDGGADGIFVCDVELAGGRADAALPGADRAGHGRD